MIEIKMPVSDDLLLDKDEVKSILQRMYDKGYHDAIEAYRTMLELEREECEEQVSCTECEHYDKEKHYCPRFCSVIRDAVKESEEPAEWIVDTDDSRRWDRVRFYCSSCNSWNTYGKSKYCPNCGARMAESEDKDANSN